LLTVLGAFGGLAAGIGLAVAYVLGTGSSDVATGTITPAGITVSNASVDGLYPGASKTMNVSVENTGPYPLRPVSVTKGNSSAPCPTSLSLSLASPALTTVLPPSSGGAVPVTVTMSTDAPGICASSSISVPFTILVRTS
jgi:hypothetical protein